MTIFLYFSLAFDAVNYEILATKLGCCGIGGISLNWFKFFGLTGNRWFL